MGRKKLAETEKGKVGQVERESNVDGFFFDIEGIVHHEFLCQGQTVNRWYYLKMLIRLRKCQEKKTSAVEKQLLVPPS
jgi:hypothetical protein